MRIGFLLLTIFLNLPCLFSQTVFQQKLNFQAHDLSVNDALLKLSKESGVPIAFNPQFFKKSKSVSINVKQQSLEVILANLLDDTSISYRLLGQQIVLFKKKKRYHNISGYLEDTESGERLITARVYCPTLKVGAITNEYGFYSLSLEKGEWDIVFYHAGYQTIKKRISITEDLRQDLTLNPSWSLPEVVISPESVNRSVPVENSDKSYEIPANFVKNSPNLGGEQDLVQTVQLMPGVQGGIDGLGGMYVRGGESGQNLMLMDGVPVYIPFHLLGFYSIYNASAISSAKLLKGNFSSRYGGRLSSVLDVRMKEGNKKGIKGEFSANLINGKGLLEGPINGENGSFLIAGRVAHNGFLLNPSLQKIFFQNEEDDLNTGFYDVNIKANYTLSDKDRLYLSLFNGYDSVTKDASFEEDDGEVYSEMAFGWENVVGALRWNHLVNSQLFINTTITYSNYGFESVFYEEYLPEDTLAEEFFFLNSASLNRDIGFKIDVDYIPHSKHTIRFGIGGADRNFRPDFTYFEEDEEEFEDLEEFDAKILAEFVESEIYKAKELYAYFEDDIQLNPKLNLRAGLRGSSFFEESQSFFRLEPRLLLNYEPSKQLSIHASFNRMVQYLHLITNSTLRLPNDIWLPASEDLLPQGSWQSELGFRFHPSEELTLSLDVYHKYMNNLYTYPDDFSFLDEVEDELPADYLLKGEGEAYGVEGMLTYNTPKTGAMLSYAITNTTRRYDGQNLNNKYPHEQDARHQLKLFIYHQLNRRLKLSLNWMFLSAIPRVNLWAVPSGEGLLNFNLNPEGQRNLTRSKAYQRLDVSAAYEFHTKKLDHRISIGLYNAYNYKNVAYHELNLEEDDRIISGEALFSLPLLPSFSYTLSF